MKSTIVPALPILLMSCVLTSCSSSSTPQPSLIAAVSMTNSNTTKVCLQGTNYTRNGTLQFSLLMPPYTIGAQSGPNPVTNTPYGAVTADGNGTYTKTFLLERQPAGDPQVVCAKNPPSQPVFLLVDTSTNAVGAVSIPAGYVCPNLPAPTSSIGNQSICQF